MEGIPFFSYHYPVLELCKDEVEKRAGRNRTVWPGERAFLRAASEFVKGSCKCGRKWTSSHSPGHNENDPAETVIHNLCRGTGLKGFVPCSR